MNTQDLTEAAYVIALRRSRQRRTRKLALVLVAVLCIVGYLLGTWWQSLDHFPVIATTTMKDGTELRIHAVLQPTDPDFALPDWNLLSRSRRKIDNRRNSNTLNFVLSRRDTTTREWLNFEWFGSLSVEDRHGTPVSGIEDGTLIRASWIDSSSNRRSETNIGPADSRIPNSLPKNSSYHFLVVPMCLPDTNSRPVLNIRDTHNRVVASMQLPVELPKPITIFDAAKCSFRTQNDDWSGELFELEYAEPRGRSRSNDRMTSQANINFKAEFQHQNLRLSPDQTVQSATQFTDKMGNTYDVSSGFHHWNNKAALPYGPPTWRLTTKVARNTNADFAAVELTPLGMFELSEKRVEATTTAKNVPKHLVILPAGKNQFLLDADAFSIQHPTDKERYPPEYGNYALGAELSVLPDAKVESKGGGGSYSGYDGEWDYKSNIGVKLAAGEDRIFVSIEVFATSSESNTLSTTDSPWPLVMLALNPEETESVHHLVVKDNTGKAVETRACFHPIKHVPIYAINITEEHRQPLSFFYHSETPTELQFTIPSPHTVIERPENPSWTFSSRMVPDGDQWQQIDSRSSNTDFPDDPDEPSHD